MLAHAADLRHVGEPVEDELREGRSLLDGKEHLLVQVRLRIARDGDVRNLFGPHARHLEHRPRRERRKPGAVLAAIEPLLLDGRNQPAVLDENRRGIAVERVEPEDYDHPRVHVVIITHSPLPSNVRASGGRGRRGLTVDTHRFRGQRPGAHA